MVNNFKTANLFILGEDSRTDFEYEHNEAEYLMSHRTDKQKF